MTQKQDEMVIMQILPALEIGGVERGTIEIAAALKKAGIINYVCSNGGKMVPESHVFKCTQIGKNRQRKGCHIDACAFARAGLGRKMGFVHDGRAVYDDFPWRVWRETRD